eukprot:scaffold10066_cov100-Cylindrotheca_fusiformis.AAC.6
MSSYVSLDSHHHHVATRPSVSVIPSIGKSPFQLFPKNRLPRTGGNSMPFPNGLLCRSLAIVSYYQGSAHAQSYQRRISQMLLTAIIQERVLSLDHRRIARRSKAAVQIAATCTTNGDSTINEFINNDKTDIRESSFFILNSEERY